MTENEKAAIAGGIWTPAQRCGPSWDVACEHHERLYGDHNIPAPDMSRPENYMRAFDNLRPSHYIRVEISSAGYCVVIESRFRPFCAESDCQDTAGEAAREALALFHDAEHADEVETP